MSKNNKGILEARIKQMAEGNYKDMGENFSLDEFDPKGETKSNNEVVPTIETSFSTDDTDIDMNGYIERFLTPRTFEKRTSFPINRVTLDILKDILHDLECKTSLSAYVENILIQHLLTYRELINEATDKRIRKPTIPKL